MQLAVSRRRRQRASLLVVVAAAIACVGLLRGCSASSAAATCPTILVLSPQSSTYANTFDGDYTTCSMTSTNSFDATYTFSLFRVAAIGVFVNLSVPAAICTVVGSVTDGFAVVPFTGYIGPCNSYVPVAAITSFTGLAISFTIQVTVQDFLAQTLPVSVCEIKAISDLGYDKLPPVITVPPAPPSICLPWGYATVVDNCLGPLPSLPPSYLSYGSCTGAIYYGPAYDLDQNSDISSVPSFFDHTAPQAQDTYPNQNCAQPTTLDAFDDCTPPANITSILLSQSPTLFEGCFGQAVFRTWSAADLCGNVAQVTQIVCITSNPPMVTYPPDVEIPCTGDTSLASTGNIAVVDQCDNTPSISPPSDFLQLDASCTDYGTILRTWDTISDTYGSSMPPYTQTIVLRRLPPVFVSFPADVTYQCNAVGPTSPAFVGTPTSAPVCAGALTSLTSSVSYSDFTLAGCGNTYTVRT